MKILLVEDDLDLGKGVGLAMQAQHIDVVWVRRLVDVPRALDAGDVDVVVLDLGLPDGDGLDLLARLRRDRSRLPILILSARTAIHDRLYGLDSGADDYLVKPFVLAELLSRVRALARRSAATAGESRLASQQLVLYEATRTVTLDGVNIELSRTEFDLLAVLLRQPGRVVARYLLEETALPHGRAGASNTLDVHISNLRRKIGKDAIRTVRGIGYAMSTASTEVTSCR
ncbi:response regulator [Pigmentiphaga litoralis]|uniref:Two-component system response regulator QseB n=1 Tax=Pigmentiphaga litoralis TaxID=516702 RepID=A0A7Y9IU17_9BURK|nr:response regulator [Pigmentiphaga litoralis]NYE23335.1 two-component system response regulator QseB [Pigmentiphaga litoralis]NYE83051.1 two-component system response regulator QseB [Pigmentiphaga litoralis]